MLKTSVRRSPPVSDSFKMDNNVAAWFHRGNDRDELKLLYPGEGQLERGCSVAICTHKRAKSLNRFLDSLVIQDRRPDKLVIVDASPDDETEQALKNRQDIESLADCLLYFRVSGPLKGLTRQRNFALRWVTTDLVVFFDDDIVLLPNCLREMEKAHRLLGDQVVGVGAFIQNTLQRPGWLWRLRLLFHLVPSLQPGRYYRSGISTSWRFLPPTEELVEGDWLSGGAAMWKTAAAREVGFDEGLGGYAQGEDLEFSLRARRKGKLVLAGAARLQHLHEPSGRPDHYMKGYMLIHNIYRIHHRALPDRTWRDIAWFIYAWTLDTLFLVRHSLFPRRCVPTLRHIAGRLRAVYDIMGGR